MVFRDLRFYEIVSEMKGRNQSQGLSPRICQHVGLRFMVPMTLRTK